MSEHRSATAPARGGARRAPKRRRNPAALIAVIAVLALFAGALYWGASTAVGRFQGPDDYSGPGTGEVLFQVEEGDTATAIGRGLADEDVVASVEAFIEAAKADPASAGIQVGFYRLKAQMSAEQALAVLVDPVNLVKNAVTVPEGLRVKDVLALLGEKTEFDVEEYRAALKDPALGLPSWAGDDAEGYLFPATYQVLPEDQPVDILQKMVDRWHLAAEEAALESSASGLGRSPAEIMVIASLIQAEGRGDDMPKVSRVIWNRLDGPGNKRGTHGLLQVDAAVNYALDQRGTTEITDAQKQSVADSPYNTYTQVGLPPGPINNPGHEAIDAATHPAEGDWYYYVTVDLATGETKFAKDHDEFLAYKSEYKSYCERSERC